MRGGENGTIFLTGKKGTGSSEPKNGNYCMKGSAESKEEGNGKDESTRYP